MIDGGRSFDRSVKEECSNLPHSSVVDCDQVWSTVIDGVRSIDRSIDWSINHCSAAGVAYYDYLRNGTFCFIMNEEDTYITTELGFNLEMHPKYNKSSSHNKVKCETTK